MGTVKGRPGGHMAIGLKLVANELCQKYERFFRVEAQYRKRPSVKKEDQRWSGPSERPDSCSV